MHRSALVLVASITRPDSRNTPALCVCVSEAEPPEVMPSRELAERNRDPLGMKHLEERIAPVRIRDPGRRRVVMCRPGGLLARGG